MLTLSSYMTSERISSALVPILQCAIAGVDNGKREHYLSDAAFLSGVNFVFGHYFHACRHKPMSSFNGKKNGIHLTMYSVSIRFHHQIQQSCQLHVISIIFFCSVWHGTHRFCEAPKMEAVGHQKEEEIILKCH